MKCFSTMMTLAMVALLAVPASAVTAVYDFAQVSGDSADAGVNVVLHKDSTAFPANPEFGQNVANSIDTSGASTGISLTIQNDKYFNVNNGPNGSGTTAPTGDAATYFGRAPDENLTSDGLYGHTSAFQSETRPEVEYLIEGLDANGLYDFIFFADRGNGGGDRSAAYTVGGMSDTVDVFENNDKVAEVLGAQANGNGELTLLIGPSATNNNGLGFFYLGAMQISTAVPEPTSLLLASFAGLAMLGMGRKRS